MGIGDEPALGSLLVMHRTEHFGTGQKRPTRLLFSLTFGFKRYVDEVIC